jgi:hypothetical protein
MLPSRNGVAADPHRVMEQLGVSRRSFVSGLFRRPLLPFPSPSCLTGIRKVLRLNSDDEDVKQAVFWDAVPYSPVEIK